MPKCYGIHASELKYNTYTGWPLFLFSVIKFKNTLYPGKKTQGKGNKEIQGIEGLAK